MRLFKLSLLCCLALASNAYAIFCPTNFSAINYGDSVEQVIAQCGKPNELKRYQVNGNTAQQWTYFVKPHGYEQNTVKMTVLISNNQVSNITLDDESQGAIAACQSALLANPQLVHTTCNIKPTAQSLSSTPICGFPIKIGDNPQVVQVACGKPAVTQVVGQDSQQPGTVDLAELTYSGPPRVSLVFEDNRLKERRFL